MSGRGIYSKKPLPSLDDHVRKSEHLSGFVKSQTENKNQFCRFNHLGVSKKIEFF